MEVVLIRRRKKYEAAQAIIDLVERGFEVVYPLTELTSEGKKFYLDMYKKPVFINNSFHSCWIAKLVRNKT